MSSLITLGCGAGRSCTIPSFPLGLSSVTGPQWLPGGTPLEEHHGVMAMHCQLGVDDDPEKALERLARFSRVASRLPRLPRLEPRGLRSIIAGMMKDLATVSAARRELGLDEEEWSRLAARCGRLLNEVGRAVATLEALIASGSPGPHAEALRRVAEILASDPCMSEIERAVSGRGRASAPGEPQ